MSTTGSEFTCEECPEGAPGDGQSCFDVNECVLPYTDSRRHRCQAGCMNIPQGYVCFCDPGWRLDDNNRDCHDIKECDYFSLNDCVYKNHKSVCIDEPPGSYTCTCEPGYQMMDDYSCEDIDECATMESECAGVCINTVGSYICQCTLGYAAVAVNGTIVCQEESLCTTPVNQCDQSCTDTLGGFTCGCNEGYNLDANGVSCNVPASSRCRSSQCDQDVGECILIDGLPQCLCPTGYTMNADTSKCQDVNECALNVHKCSEFAECRNSIGSYMCECSLGFEFEEGSDTECQNINECTSTNNTAELCQFECIDLHGTHACECPLGHMITPGGQYCVDINECSDGTYNECDRHADCTNTKGSYNCQCKVGYTGNGVICTALDPCLVDNGGCMGGCEMSASSADGSGRICTCGDGYWLDPVDHTTCHDVDECSHPDPPCSHFCQNTVGSRICSCRPGFELAPNGYSCNVLVPCSIRCGGGQCQLIDEEPQCVCDQGYKIDSVGTCADIDECTETHLVNVTVIQNNITTTELQTKEIHRCDMSTEATCHNLIGSYQCVCPAGYIINGDGITCADVNECIILDPALRHDCDLETSSCINYNGTYQCECKDGFRDIFSICQDIDECSEDEVSAPSCDNQADCVNLPGSYQCKCREGYFGNGFQCQDINECTYMEWNTCRQNEKEICKNLEGSYECQCLQGYKKDPTGERCIDIDECSSSSLNTCEMECINTEGSYHCACPEGYQLDSTTGRKCEVANQCKNGDIAEACAHHCIRLNGVDQCACKSGYTRDGNSCTDINECTTTVAEVAHHCGVHSWCNNTQGGYHCVCDRYYIPDADQLACSTSNGNWGIWSQWSECSKECHGRRSRYKTCDQPPPTRGRHCEGRSDNYALCHYGMDNCIGDAAEIAKGVMVTFPDLHSSMWESVEGYFFDAVCSQLLAWCQNTSSTYEQCCGKPRPSAGVDRHAIYCTRADFFTAFSYPRVDMATRGTRAMIYSEVSAANTFCGTINIDALTDPEQQEQQQEEDTTTSRRRRRRQAQEQSAPSGTRYTIPQGRLLQVVTSDAVYARVTKLLRESPVDNDLATDMHYTAVAGYDEDIETVTSRVIVEDEKTPVYIISLGVFFALIGLVLLGVTIYCLLRRPTKQEECDEGSVLVTNRDGLQSVTHIELSARNVTPAVSPQVKYGEQYNQEMLRAEEGEEPYERGASRLGRVMRHPRECETPIVPFIVDEGDLDPDDDVARSVILDDLMMDGEDEQRGEDVEQLSDDEADEEGENGTAAKQGKK